jgi:hypothetical protein
MRRRSSECARRAKNSMRPAKMVAVCVVILHWTNAPAQGDLWVDASVIVPGMVVAAVYTLMTVYCLPRS